MKQFSKFLSGFVVGILTVALCSDAVHSIVRATPTPSIAVDSTPIDRSVSGLTSFAPVVKKAAPSVVNIYSSHIVRYHQFNPFFNDPMFRQFFGDQFGPDQRQMTRHEQVLGSGVIISADGYILTANHVVEGADEVKIAVPGNKNEYTAKIIGTDPPTDVAVLKIDATDLPAITLGDSSKLEVGDIVLAIGNPFGISSAGESPSVTMGIVSALGRSGLGFSRYENFIQTDAAINPGNSGGALVDAEGRLVGINTAIATANGSSMEGNEGIGFAVPINLARHVVERLVHGEKVTRGYLGVVLRDLDQGLAESFNLPNENGALVNDVEPNSPADKAAIKSGDVIVEFNGQKITDANDLSLAVADCAPDTKATVKFIRDGKEHVVTVTLAEMPGVQQAQNNQTDALNGVSVGNLDSQTRSDMQVPDEVHGVIVTDVDPDSHAAEAGLQKGDIIVSIDHHPVRDADQAVNLCNEARGKYILLKIWRREEEMSGTRYLSVDNTKSGQ